jgi:hypothetical protein
MTWEWETSIVNHRSKSMHFLFKARLLRVFLLILYPTPSIWEDWKPCMWLLHEFICIHTHTDSYRLIPTHTDSYPFDPFALLGESVAKPLDSWGTGIGPLPRQHRSQLRPTGCSRWRLFWSTWCLLSTSEFCENDLRTRATSTTYHPVLISQHRISKSACERRPRTRHKECHQHVMGMSHHWKILSTYPFHWPTMANHWTPEHPAWHRPGNGVEKRFWFLPTSSWNIVGNTETARLWTR